jgi:hypothetical protein
LVCVGYDWTFFEVPKIEPLLDHINEINVYAILDRVFNMFGLLAHVFIELQVIKFHGEFQKLHEKKKLIIA